MSVRAPRDGRPWAGLVRAAAGSDALVAMSTKAVQGGSMALAAVFVIWKTSPAAQGFYFAFISFALMLQLCDFGLSYASLQAASHLRAAGRVRALAALVARSLRVNAAVAVAASLVVGAIGWLLFEREGSDDVSWQAPWVVFVVLVGLNQMLGAYPFLVEGAVSVTRAWRHRLVQEVLSGVALLVVLAWADDGPWALGAYYATRLATSVALVVRIRLPFDRSSAARADLAASRLELWAFQWRVGTGAVAGFLAFQAFGPILFALQGPGYAGRFSLSLAMMNAVVMVTTAWPISQAAHFGALSRPSDEGRLWALWQSVLWRSSVFVFVATLGLMAVLFAIDHWAPRVIVRFDVMSATLLLLACAMVHHLIACFTVLMRSERRDPMLVPNVVGGVVGVLLMSIAGFQSGTTMIAFVYLLWSLVLLVVAWKLYRDFAARRFPTVGR